MLVVAYEVSETGPKCYIVEILTEGLLLHVSEIDGDWGLWILCDCDLGVN